MSMELSPLVLALLIVALLHPAAGAADEDARRSGGFRLPLVPSPGWNSTIIRVDGDGFLHLQMRADATALRPCVSPPRGLTFSVPTTVGTGQGRRTYALKLDTSSSLTWMQCAPCENPFPQAPPPFDPTSSPSFRSSRPTAPYCLPQDPQHPSRRTRCEFLVNHLNGAVAEGLLGHDVFAFPSGHVPAFTFGCAHHSTGFRSQGVFAGVLGLGKQEPSLIRQLAAPRRFSYCLFGLEWPNRHGFLRFGGDVPDTGHMKSTRMLYTRYELDPVFSPYYVDVVGVSVGAHRLPGITRDTFKFNHNNRRGGCVIDTGTSVMHMVQPAYDAVQHAVAEHLRSFHVPRVHRDAFRFCFRATNAIRPHLPTVTLHLAEHGVGLVITPERLFLADDDATCLAVDVGPRTVVSALQQLNTRFVYDLAAGRIFFAPEKCHLDTGGHN